MSKQIKIVQIREVGVSIFLVFICHNFFVYLLLVARYYKLAY